MQGLPLRGDTRCAPRHKLRLTRIKLPSEQTSFLAYRERTSDYLCANGLHAVIVVSYGVPLQYAVTRLPSPPGIGPMSRREGTPFALLVFQARCELLLVKSLSAFGKKSPMGGSRLRTEVQETLRRGRWPTVDWCVCGLVAAAPLER